jgi:H+/Cl- antiporter ClcA
MAERVGFVLPLIPKDFGSSRFFTSPKSYQKWGKSSVRNVAEIEDTKSVPKDASLWNVLTKDRRRVRFVRWSACGSKRKVAVADKLRHCPAELRAAIIGAAVGALAWIAPGLVGSGDHITQSVLDGVFVLTPLIFLIRFALGPISYAAATPGGLFAPLLAVGAQLGLIFAALCQFLFAGLHIQPEAFAVVGMAAFFAGVVRAPLTGIVLVTEMTGSVAMLLPMLGACFAAMSLTTLLGNPPIYASLLRRIEKLRGIDRV